MLGAVLALVCALIAIPAQAEEQAFPPAPWQSALHRSHPLNGKIWSAQTGQFVPAAEYAKALAAADIVLLGENHDNPDHHILQAWVLQQVLADWGENAVVIFEMIGAEEEEALTKALNATPPPLVAELGPILRWEARGWPSFAIYQPIAEAVINKKAKFRAGYGANSETMQVAKQGLNGMAPEKREKLALNNELPAPDLAALMDELFKGHCEMIGREKLAPMAAIQRFRDASLADAALTALADAGKPAVIIAGNGHVRKDRGAPLYIQSRDAGKRVVSVMHVETGADTIDRDSFIATRPDGKPAADFFLFTPAADRGDPCDAFRKKR
jgi:uncharacterized iron-regulated protein